MVVAEFFVAETWTDAATAIDVNVAALEALGCVDRCVVDGVGHVLAPPCLCAKSSKEKT